MSFPDRPATPEPSGTLPLRGHEFRIVEVGHGRGAVGAVFRALLDILFRFIRFRAAAYRVFSCGWTVCGSMCWLKRWRTCVGRAWAAGVRSGVGCFLIFRGDSVGAGPFLCCGMFDRSRLSGVCSGFGLHFVFRVKRKASPAVDAFIDLDAGDRTVTLEAPRDETALRGRCLCLVGKENGAVFLRTG